MVGLLLHTGLNPWSCSQSGMINVMVSKAVDFHASRFNYGNSAISSVNVTFISTFNRE